jgi:hypothetical protein
VHFARLLSSLVISQHSATSSAAQHSARRRSVKKQQHSLFTPHMTKLKSRCICITGAAATVAKSMPGEREKSVSSSGVFTPQGAFSVWCVLGACTRENLNRERAQEDAPAIMEAELKLASGGRLPPFPHLTCETCTPSEFFYTIIFLSCSCTEPDGICGVARGKG